MPCPGSLCPVPIGRLSVGSRTASALVVNLRSVFSRFFLTRQLRYLYIYSFSIHPHPFAIEVRHDAALRTADPDDNTRPRRTAAAVARPTPRRRTGRGPPGTDGRRLRRLELQLHPLPRQTAPARVDLAACRPISSA